MDSNIAESLIEALIFCSEEPLSESYLSIVLNKHGKFNVREILLKIKTTYDKRGINLVNIEKKWFFKTSLSIKDYLKIEHEKKRKLSKATMETLAIISYHQPVTRAEIEKVRGKPVFKGTLDILLNLKWIKPHERRETPGRPVTWVTDFEFLKHFGLSKISDLPKIDELESISFNKNLT